MDGRVHSDPAIKPEALEGLLKPGEKWYCVEDESSDIPPQVLRQRMLNKSTVAALSRALSQDPAADLAPLLSQLAETYALKRHKTSDSRPLIRKTRYTKQVSIQLPQNDVSPLQKPTIIYPLAPAVRDALGLSESCSIPEQDRALNHFLKFLQDGNILFQAFRRQVTLLPGCTSIVVKSGPALDPSEHPLLEYLQKYCPTVRSPKPLGFVVMNGVSYFFMTHVPGVTLYSRWPTLNASQKKMVANQLNDMLLALRAVPWSPGTPLGSIASPHICKDTRKWTRSSGVIYSEAEFNNFLLRCPRQGFSTSYVTWLHSRLRHDHRIVLTHGDLNPKNIILLDGARDTVSISGVVDWEMGGWYPEYWDSLKALNTRGPDDDSDWWISLPEPINQHVAEVALDTFIEAVISGE